MFEGSEYYSVETVVVQPCLCHGSSGNGSIVLAMANGRVLLHSYAVVYPLDVVSTCHVATMSIQNEGII